MRDPQLLESTPGDPAISYPIKVALVTMPFVSHHRPSLQIGLLKAIAEAQGFPTTTFHLNLDFAVQVGLKLYKKLCQHRGYLLGEWLFSRAAFGELAPDPEDNFLNVFGPKIDELLEEAQTTREHLFAIRNQVVPAYIDKLVKSIDWSEFDVVGFTSTFQQNTASFALAKAVKKVFPEVCLIFGGANFEGEMGLELIRTIDCIDYAVIGEGDKAFPEFLKALQNGQDPAQVPGVVTLRDGRVTPYRARPLITKMDELPIPDYTEYFDRAEMLNLLDASFKESIDIPFESSRGCWWGYKHQCTFCGLNGTGIGYRMKSPDRMLAEFRELARRHPFIFFEAVDNIMDLSYFDTFLQQLAAEPKKYNLFYEVKANLSRHQVKLFKDSGVLRIQPGIESLNTHVLKLMRKGITAIQNINTMRWAQYYRINLGWNLIWGFPGETAEDYKDQADLMRQLYHLQPPDGSGRIWMERFSPIFMDKESFPTRYTRPEASYTYVYPKEVDLNRVAYFFDYEFEQNLDQEFYQDTLDVIKEWQTAWKADCVPGLTFRTDPAGLIIEDWRKPAQPQTFNFAKNTATLYQACSDKPQTLLSLKTKPELAAFPLAEIEKILAELVQARLMMQDGNFFLSLALPAYKKSRKPVS